jgi:uncharacterized protein YegL
VPNKVNCLPVYIIIDTSQSMAPVEDLLNQSIEQLYDELITRPMIADFANVSLLSYNTDAEVIMTMTDLQSMTALPQVACGGVTNFVKAIHLLRSRIDNDVPTLTSAGREVLRPVAFLLTDGAPTDEQGYLSDAWKPEFKRLVDPSWRRHPNVVPFGYGGARAEDLAEIATIPGAAFMAENGGTSDALSRVIPALLNTLVSSARERELRLPSEVDGFIRVPPEGIA